MDFRAEARAKGFDGPLFGACEISKVLGGCVTEDDVRDAWRTGRLAKVDLTGTARKCASEAWAVDEWIAGVTD